MSGDLNEYAVLYLPSAFPSKMWLYEQLNQRFGAEVIWIVRIVFAALLKSREFSIHWVHGTRGQGGGN